MTQRNQSLDALRGFAILTMVLSGSIAFGGVLPAWMYHAQVPPPDHKFVPTLPGLTWVDLVFPFFLFSMGAAIPLSLSRAGREGKGWPTVLGIAVRRFLLLVFFAIFSFHMRAWVISDAPERADYLLSILGFVLLFFQFYEYKGTRLKQVFTAIRIAAFAAAAVLLYVLPFGTKGFQKERSDIIILVLANMALFGTIIWWATRERPLLRLGVLPFVMAVLLGGKEKGSWNEWVYHWPDQHWIYWFYYLKYLFLIIPGTFAGEWLLQRFRDEQPATRMTSTVTPTVAPEEGALATAVRTQRVVVPQAGPRTETPQPALITALAFGLIVMNLALLFGRQLLSNLVATTALLVFMAQTGKKDLQRSPLLKRCFEAGAYLLLLGLAFEAYEGGVKKDPSTYSYYFITSGLAFFMLIGFNGLRGPGGRITNYLAMNGRNPMVAYVAGNLLLLPLLKLTGLSSYLDAMNGNAWIGFLRGVLFTGIVSGITVLFVKRGWFWKS